MNIFWMLGANGDFATASNWTPAAVPGPADDAIIIGFPASSNWTPAAVPGPAEDAPASFTVTSSINETIDSLIIANATLLIAGGTFTTTSGGFNAGTITVDSSLNVGTTGENTTLTNIGQIDLNSDFFVAGDVSLQGHGQVALSGVITGGSSSSGATLSTNNVIAGIGTIRGFSLINEVGRVIDATGSRYLYLESSNIQNSGILEATNPAGLGNPAALFVQSSTIDNTPSGVIEAVGVNTSVFLYGVTVVGGTLKTIGHDAVIHAGVTEGATLDGSQASNPVNIEGNVIVDAHTTLGLKGTIDNSGTVP
jgi:hypothetical protein